MVEPRTRELELADVPFTDPLETIRRGSELVSSKVGLVTGLGQGAHRAQDPSCFSLGVRSTDVSRFSDTLSAGKAGGGGDSLAVALAATFGEMVERYCMLFYDRREMVLAPHREVADDAVEPELLRLYSRGQVAAVESQRLDYFDEDAPVRWVWAHSLTRGGPRLVPAALVYMNYRFEEDEAAIGRNASTGLAAGLTLEEAILTGLYEVVERDAFTIAWLHRWAGPRIEVDDPELASLMASRFKTDHPSVDLRIHDVTLDIPMLSIFAAMRRPAEFGPTLSVSSVCRLSPRDAVLKGFREVAQGISYFRYLMDQLDGWQPADDHRDLVSFDHHCMLYIKQPGRIDSALAFCDRIEDRVPLTEIADRSTGRPLGDLQRSVALLNDAGWEVIVADITTPDMLEVGFRVVRVMVPGLVPLHGNHNRPFLGVRRLYDIAGWLDERSPDRERLDGFNPHPHPFP